MDNGAKAAKQRRLAEALRANLKRRKVAAGAGRRADDDTAASGGAATTGDTTGMPRPQDKG